MWKESERGCDSNSNKREWNETQALKRLSGADREVTRVDDLDRKIIFSRLDRLD